MNLIAKCCTIFIIFYSQSIFAQKSFIKFDPQHCDSFLHPVKEVRVVDMRSDTNALLGRIRVGLMNAQQSIKTEAPLSTSLEKFYRELSGNTPSSGTDLVVLLHTFYAFEDKPGFSSETARFKYAADYFIGKGSGNYELLGVVDTTIMVRGFDVTKKLMNTIDHSLAGIYDDLYHNKPPGKIYTYDEVLNYEDEQKLSIPAYATSGIDNAVYKTWEDFKLLNAKPNESIIKKGKLFRIKYFTTKGKEKHAPAYYAKVIAYDNKFYCNIEGVFYEMIKKKNDFHVAGMSSAFRDNSDVAIAGMMFGALGAMVASSASGGVETYEFKIHYKEGELIPVKRTKLK